NLPQVAQLVVDFVRTSDRPSDFVAQFFSILAPETMDRCFDRTQRKPKLRRGRLIRCLSQIRSQERRQAIEKPLFTARNEVGAQIGQGLFEECVGPAFFEKKFRRDGVGRFEPIPRIGLFGIETNKFPPATPFLGLGTLAFVRQEVLERRKKKSAKFSSLTVCLRQGVLLLKVQTEGLDQVFRVVFGVSVPADKSIERVPVDLEQTGERFLSLDGTVFLCAGEDHRPASRIEAGPPGGESLRSIHAPNLGSL